MTNVPYILGHRGASAHAPENTLKAFSLAADKGADGVELDVYLTRDGKLAVIHDDIARDVHGRSLIVRASTMEELKGLDIGDGEKIPTLDEVFNATAGRFKIINVEIKSTGFFTDGIEKVLLNCIDRFRIEPKIVVSSFNPLHLRRIKALRPSIKTGFLVDTDRLYLQCPYLISFCGAQTVNINNHWGHEHPGRVESFLKTGADLWVWTVNSATDMDYWRGRGAKALITNYL